MDTYDYDMLSLTNLCLLVACSTLCVTVMMVNGIRERDKALERSTMPSNVSYRMNLMESLSDVCFQWVKIHW